MVQAGVTRDIDEPTSVAAVLGSSSTGGGVRQVAKRLDEQARS
jgi:hypothetical protein